MGKDAHAYLAALMDAPSPSGYEEPAARIWREAMKPLAEKVYTDTHGNSIAVRNSQGTPRVMLAGHIDEVGFQVSALTKDGAIVFHPIGRFDEGIVPGRRVVIHTAKGPVLGVVGKKPIHLMTRKEIKKVAKIDELRIDIGARSGKQAQKLVELGDPITIAEGFVHLRGTRYIARGMDNKGGAFAVGETLRYLRRKRFSAAVYAVATVQEEIGQRGAITSSFGIAPDVGIVVDATFAWEPSAGTKMIGTIELGKGPAIARGPNFNPKLFERIVHVARKQRIPYQIEALPQAAGTDADMIQLARGGVATALISIPMRYMHTMVGMFDFDDLQNVIKLLSETVLSLHMDSSFLGSVTIQPNSPLPR